MNRNCPKYSPWLYMCDIGCSILLGYQHKYKVLSSLSLLVSCSGGLKHILHPDAGLGGMGLALRTSWWHTPIPKNRTASNPLLLKTPRLVSRPRSQGSMGLENLLLWEIMKNYSTRAVPALGPAWTSLGVSRGVVSGGISAHW